MKIALNNPLRPDLQKLNRYLQDIEDSAWYTNFGNMHNQLTQQLEAYLGVSNLLLVNNGTSALQVAAKALDVESVVTTPFSFIATTSALQWQGHEVFFADIDEDTWNIDAEKAIAMVDSVDRINAVVSTHVYGNPCDVELLESVSRKGKKVIYDAAHAFGININGRSVLSYGDASTLSFHATKLFHTVEGGAICFKSKTDYEVAKKLINFGRHESMIGINAKMNEYQAAVGLVNLEIIDDVIVRRAEIYSLYEQLLCNYFKLPNWHTKANFNGAYFAFSCKSESERADVEQALNSHGIQHRRYFEPSINLMIPNAPSMPLSEKLTSQVLCLPLHYYLTNKEVNQICDIIKQVVK